MTSSRWSAMPSSAAIACAVAGWSPVIMMTSTPASRQAATASFGLGPQRIDEPDQAEQGQRRQAVLVEVLAGARQAARRPPPPAPGSPRRPARAPPFPCASRRARSRRRAGHVPAERQDRLGRALDRDGDRAAVAVRGRGTRAPRTAAPTRRGSRRAVRPPRARPAARGPACSRGPAARRPSRRRCADQPPSSPSSSVQLGLVAEHRRPREPLDAITGRAVEIAVPRRPRPRPRRRSPRRATANAAPAGRRISLTVCWLTVRVPVLSLAMIWQLPRLSTAVSLRTITLRLAMREVAIDSATVRATGRPSGIADTASATARKKTSSQGMPWLRAIAASTAHAPSTMKLIWCAKRSMRIKSGGLLLSPSATERAILPTSVCGARGDDQPGAAAGHRGRPGEGDVVAVADAGLLVELLAGLGRGLRLAGQERLVHLQAARLEQAQVGRHLVAGFQEHDVAGHQFLGVDGVVVAAPLDARTWIDSSCLQRGGARLGLPFLDGADRRVQDDHQQDEDRVLHLADRQRHRRGGEQHVDQGVGELVQDDRQQGGRFLAGQDVRVLVEASSASGSSPWRGSVSSFWTASSGVRACQGVVLRAPGGPLRWGRFDPDRALMVGSSGPSPPFPARSGS
jgi:hypothetical protein